MKVVLLLSALAASAYAQYWVIIVVSTRLDQANRPAELRAGGFVSPIWRLPIQ